VIPKICTNRFSIATTAIIVVVLAVGTQISRANGDPQVNAERLQFYIDIGEKQSAELVNKAQSLTRGASVTSVKATLGEPTSDQKLLDKKGQFRARELTYYIRKLNKSTVNEIHDRYLAIYFDEADKLKSVRYKLTDGKETETPL